MYTSSKKESSEHLKYRQNISSKQSEPKIETKTEINRFSFSNQTNVGGDHHTLSKLFCFP